MFALRIRNLAKLGTELIPGIAIPLNLSKRLYRKSSHDVRHTMGVLHDYGNLSSGSFLFSYERLVDEGVVAAGDYGVLMTMGPGSTIEMLLVRW